MRYVRFLAASLLLGALAGTPDQCSANGFGGYGGYYGPGLYGYGLGIGQLYRSLDFPLDRRVPYFAARPPVDYSAPVPRTYGRWRGGGADHLDAHAARGLRARAAHDHQSVRAAGDRASGLPLRETNTLNERPRPHGRGVLCAPRV